MPTTITGTEGDDGLYDTSDSDIINALGGDDDVDIIFGGHDTIDGGAGRDRLQFRFEFIPGDRGAFTLNSTQNGGSIGGTAGWANGGSFTTFSNFEDIWVTSLYGNFNDSITTGAGDDIVEGSGGQDVLNLGGGIDIVTYTFLGNQAVTMTISSTDANGNNGAIDGGTNRIDFTGVDIFNLRSGAQNDVLLGGQYDDVLRAGNGDDELRGFAGNDTLMGDSGSDLIEGGDGDDRLFGGDGDDEIHGGTGNDHIEGGVGSEVISGGTGNDTITGGTTSTIDGGAGDDNIVAYGNSTVNGGSGNDRIEGSGTLSGDDGDDEIFVLGVHGGTHSGGSGQDRLHITMIDDFGNLQQNSFSEDPAGGYQGSYTVTGVPDLRILSFSGIEAFTIVGNRYDNSFQTGAGDDIIDGRAGADTMIGGAGDDIYYVDNAGDQVIENAGEGNDTIITDMAEYSLAANVENLTSSRVDSGGRYTGNGGDNVITGGGGNDTLVGNGGADTLIGRAGNDGYLVDSMDDVVVEAAGEGYDTVYTIDDYRLTPGSEIEVLTPYERELTDPLRLTGNAFANLIYGNAGNNVLTGLGGADTLYGLAGDDAYLVDDNLDTIVEADGQGYDTVYTEGDFALNNFSYVEALSVYERDTTNALTLFGNNLDNVIYGNNGSNALIGGGGTDTMYGLGGDDRFVVDSADDVVIEFAGGGNDTVYTTVSYALAATDAEVETFSVYDRDTTNALDLTGNGIANTIYGNAGTNVIDGKGGSDLLFGMGGADSFAFTSALGASNVDSIFGYVGGAGGDRILLDDAVFAGLAPGALPASAFVTGSAAADADDRIVYNSATGQLFFDADGSGAGAAVLFATLDGAPVLTASDFQVI